MMAPLLGLIVCSAITAAFVYESKRQNALLVRVTEQDLIAFNRYAEVFVNLTEEHSALYDLLSSAGKSDEATLYDRTREHLHKVQEAIKELEQGLPTGEGATTEALALRNELSATAKTYRNGVSAAVGMTTISVALAPEHVVLANERFTAMNRSFVRFLDMKRSAITSEIAARVRSNRIGNTTIAFIGVSMAALLFFLSWLLSRMLCRSIETQIGILSDLGAQAGAHFAVEGNDEVDRMTRAIAAFRQSLVANTALTSDITEMKRIDRMKSEFVSMVSHELRTPLTSIRGSLGLIAGGVAGKLPDAAKSLVDIATNNCERLIRLINNILDTEKIESGKMRFDPKVVELEPLLVQSIEANEGFAGESTVSLKLIAGEHAVRVNVDTDGVSQVLANLLSNAVKYSPPGSTVEVGLTRAHERVRVEVRDRGPGIPEEFRSRIFQKFSQADSSDSRQKGGTGLGLSISKAIVERLGGTIGFTTQTGSGTTFFFELPEWRESPDARRPAVAVDATLPGRARPKPRILHIEADPDVQHISATVARDYATFDFVTTLQGARTQLGVRKYDLILLDLNLPDGEGSGWQLVAEIDALDPPPPVVVFSARDVSRAEAERVAAVLVKADTSNDELLATILRTIALSSLAPANSRGGSLARAA